MNRIKLKEASLYWLDFIKKPKEKRKSQKQVAVNIGVTENYMTRLSTGSMPTVLIASIPKIAKEYGVDANFLFGVSSMELNDSHKVVIRTSLRMLFDYKNTDKKGAEEIIRLYELFDLGDEFIEECKNDYYQTFNEYY